MSIRTCLDGTHVFKSTAHSSASDSLPSREKNKASGLCYSSGKRTKSDKIVEVQRTEKFPLGVKVESMAEVGFKCGLEG